MGCVDKFTITMSSLCRPEGHGTGQKEGLIEEVELEGEMMEGYETEERDR